jgi:hypothetical protein
MAANHHGIDHWAVYRADSGDELTRSWPGHDDRARKMAQSWANKLGAAVQLVLESADEDDQGEIIEPEEA